MLFGGFHKFSHKVGLFLFLCAAHMLAPGILLADPGITNDTITIGQSNVFSGPLAELGKEYKDGALVYLNEVNAKGGVNGRKVALITLDDAYDPKKTVENTKILINEQKVFALAFYVGTANTGAVIPLLEAERIPLVGTLSGSNTLRAPDHFSRYLFHTKASYADELKKMIDQLVSVGIKNIAVAYQNNAFGEAGLDSAKRLLAIYAMKPAVTIPLNTDSSNLAASTATLRETLPDATLLITAGAVSQNFIKASRAAGSKTQFFSLSFVGTSGFIRDLGELSRGIVITQTVPFPWTLSMPLVKEYRAAVLRAGHEPGLVSLEGYLSARILVEGLKRAGKDLSREKFIAALEDLGSFEVGGYSMHYDRVSHNGSGFVELTMIGRNGTYIR